MEKLNRLEQRLKAVINNAELEDVEASLARIRRIAETVADKPLLVKLVRRRHDLRERLPRGFTALLWAQTEATLLECVGKKFRGWEEDYLDDRRHMMTHNSWLLSAAEDELLVTSPSLVTVAICLGELMTVHESDPYLYPRAKRRREAVLEQLAEWLELRESRG